MTILDEASIASLRPDLVSLCDTADAYWEAQAIIEDLEAEVVALQAEIDRLTGGGGSTLPSVMPSGRLYDMTTGFVGFNVSWSRAGYPASRSVPAACAAIPALIDRLNYVRVKLIRVGWPDPAEVNYGAYAMVAAAGIQVICVRSSPFSTFAEMQTAFAHIVKLEVDYPGFFCSIEGTNEYHTLSTQPPPAYKARDGVTYAVGSDAAKTKHQDDIKWLVDNNLATADIPVTNFTFSSVIAGTGFDLSNEHPYPKVAGENQLGFTSLMPRRIRDIYKARVDQWSAPMVFTETGWPSPVSGGGSALDFDTQALAYQHAIYEAYRLGVKALWFYELDNGDEGIPAQGYFGAYDRTGNSYSVDHIGYTATAKKAAVVIHNWMGVLGDTSSAQFPLVNLPMKVSGLGALDEWLLMQHSDGSYRIIFVKRDDFWKAGAPLNPASSTITLEVASGKQVAVCVPQDGETFTALPAAASYSLTLGKKPLVARVS